MRSTSKKNARVVATRAKKEQGLQEGRESRGAGGDGGETGEMRAEEKAKEGRASYWAKVVLCRRTRELATRAGPWYAD